MASASRFARDIRPIIVTVTDEEFVYTRTHAITANRSQVVQQKYLGSLHQSIRQTPFLSTALPMTMATVQHCPFSFAALMSFGWTYLALAAGPAYEGEIEEQQRLVQEAIENMKEGGRNQNYVEMWLDSRNNTQYGGWISEVLVVYAYVQMVGWGAADEEE